MHSATILNQPSRILPWGNALGLRITKAVANAAGLDTSMQVTITAQPGRIVIETRAQRPTLEQMLAAFDPSRHGGEAMAFKPVGREAL